jgi:hypothetical protein
MKVARYALLSLALLPSLSSTGWAFSEDWYTCQSDIDCVKVNVGCACQSWSGYGKFEIGINKKYKDAYAKESQALCSNKELPFTIMSKKGLERGCNVAASDPGDTDAIVRCVKNQCGSYPSDN